MFQYLGHQLMPRSFIFVLYKTDIFKGCYIGCFDNQGLNLPTREDLWEEY